MLQLKGLKPEKVFEIFEEICSVPHGSGNMERISQYCLDFAKARSLRAATDESHNVIIYKPATEGYENSEPIILQGHLDMVCQKTEDCDINFEEHGITPYVEGDFVKAKGTSLGGDNGIAVAMVLAILASYDIPHPPIEALFTTDEETGMYGAMALDVSKLKGKKLINIDSEEEDTVTVSCAGGSDFKAVLDLERENKSGTLVTVCLRGLKGGHSGIEINKNRVNADILMGRLLFVMGSVCEYEIVDINGGDKANAIPNASTARLVTENAEQFKEEAEKYLEIIKREISSSEDGFNYNVSVETEDCFEVIGPKEKYAIIYALVCTPNGVINMSADIDGLVETSLNLGVLKTEKDRMLLNYALRSNKQTALEYLGQRLAVFLSSMDFEVDVSGYYPPWEFNDKSVLQTVYKECYEKQFGCAPKVEAIHAGLECGVFASKIKGIDCISIGPDLFDVHTTSERLSISSTERIYNLLLEILKCCK